MPHQFERRYLRGEIIPPGIAARRGSATHKALQLNHKQKLHTQADLPTSDLRGAAREHYVKLITGEGVFIPKDQIAEKDTLLAKGLHAAIRLTKLFRESLVPSVQLLQVEEKMTLDACLDLPLQGTIDVLTTDHWFPNLKAADKLQNLPTTLGLEDWTNLSLKIHLMLAQLHTGLFPPCDPGA
jgi:hypothetical protein